MKKFVSILLTLGLAAGLFAGCGSSGSQAAGGAPESTASTAPADGPKTDLLLWLQMCIRDRCSAGSSAAASRWSRTAPAGAGAWRCGRWRPWCR